MYPQGSGPPFSSGGSSGTRTNPIQPPPVIGHLDALVKTLNDSTQRDDLKLKALQEISSSIDDVPNGPGFNSVVENMMRIFLKLFGDTTPQCVSENNTQMLRKLMLEMILRLSYTEAVKNCAKSLISTMIRCIITENEENVLIALKILSEHLKLRLPFVGEITNLMSHFKMMYRDMVHHCGQGQMFLTRRQVLPQWNFEDNTLENTLQQCFCVTSVHVDSPEGSDGRQIAYTLIPRGYQSVKVLGEVPSLIIQLCNMYKQQVLSDLGDLIQIIASYLASKIPAPIKEEQGFNKEVAEEFLNSQIRAFTFLAFYAKASPSGGNASDFFQNNSSQVINSMIALFESCPPEPILPRRELLVAARYFFNSEYQKNFVGMLPRLLNNNTLLGTGVTVNECLRISVVQMLCDLCHHLRNQLTFEVLVNVVYFFSLMLHTSQIFGHSQAMCCKGLMNLVEAFANLERNQNEPCRDIFLHMLDTFVRKFRFMAKHHVGPLLAKYSYSSRQRSRGVDGPAGESGAPEADEAAGSAAAKDDGSAPSVTPAEVGEASASGTTPRPGAAGQAPGASASTNQNRNLRFTVPKLPPPTKIGSKQPTIPQLCAMYNFNPPLPTSPSDARGMVRVLMQSIKLIAVGISHSHLTTEPPFSSERERSILSKLFVEGIRCLEVFTIAQVQNASPGVYQRVSSRSGVRARDEKEALDYFTNTFTMVNSDVFEAVFSIHVGFLFEKLLNNNALQFIVNGFLVHSNTSVVVGREVLKYLLKRLGDLSEVNDRSSMYLKVFKMVFSSVSGNNPSSTLENEKMLKTYLHRIVYESMQNALRAPDPTQYFLLLRSLFRSIGNGTHDLLYQSFLPLLPALLQQMCRIHSGQHRQSVRELFCELCLTVPVRLSSLLPYLPLLMDPLVYAFSGSTSLVQQGLRTLELCVDNLQPEYLYYYMAPVRSPLMQGIWRVIRQSLDVNCTTVALRITGKFGGLNRKMLLEAPHLDYSLYNPDDQNPFVTMKFRRSSEAVDDISKDGEEDESRDSQDDIEPPHATKGPITTEVDLHESVASALDHLKATMTGDVTQNIGVVLRTATNKPSSLALRQHAMYLCRGTLMMAIQTSKLRGIDFREAVVKLAKVCSTDENSQTWRTIPPFRCSNVKAREMYKNALTAIIMASAARDLYEEVIPFLYMIVRFATVIMATDQVGKSRTPEEEKMSLDGMILIDAVYEVLADSHLEFTKPAIVVLSLIHDTCFHLCGSDESAVKLPVYGHILEKMVHLCYEQQWYARHGGCSALLFIISAYPYSLIVDNAAHITSAITEVFFGLSDEVSFGTIEMARKAMRLLLKRCFPLATVLPTKHLPEEYEEKQGQAAIAIVARLLDHIADPSTFVREQVMEIFSEMAEATGKSITDLLLLQKDKVKTFLDRGVSLFMSYACAAQIAFLEAYSFLQSDLNPVIPFDMKSHVHLHFLKNVVLVCEADEEKMERLPNYTAIAPSLEHPYPYPHDRLLPVKMAALKAAVGGYVAICVAKRKVEVPKYGTLQQYLDAVAKQFHPKPRTVSRSSSSSGSTDSSNSSSCTSSSSNSDVEMEKDDEEEEEAEERNVTQEDLIKGLSSFVLVEGMPYSTKHEYMQVDRKLELHMQLLQVVLKIVVHGHPRLQKAAFEAAEGALKLCVEGLGLVTREISLLTRNFEKTPNLDCIRMKQMLYLQKLTNGTGTEKFYDICFKELVKFKERKTGTKLKMEFVGCTHLLEMLVNTSTQDPSRWIGQFVPLVAKSDSDLALPGIEWKPLLRNYLNKHARQAVSYIVNEVNLLNEPTWRLYVEFIKEKDSLPIRKVFVENEDFFEHLLKEEVLFSSKWVTRTSHYMQIKYDLAVFSLLWVVVKHHPEWWTTCEKLKKIVHETWNNPSFVHRYAMRHEPREEQDRDKPIIDYVDETKYRLPKIVASLLLQYYRNNIDNHDLLFDLTNVFAFNYISDMVFVRQYINDVVIPTFPLYWRRAAFFHVVNMFMRDPKNTATSEQVARFMMYVVVPSFAYAFERYDADEVVGSKPNPDEFDDKNLVSVLVTKIIDVSRQDMSDQMLIVIYQFCILLVQHCPSHIHEISQKLKQICHLRILMVFAWPCLQAQGPQDITVKYTGHLLIAHIIDKFAINRKIVLQVHSGLMKACSQDNRDIIRRALDVITVALPKRMDDGYLQLLLFMKKIISEEGHNVQQMTHCIGTVVRHYKVYYYVRHQMLPFLVNAVQRIVTHHSSPEAKKLIIDVCETIIKWELLRVKLVEKNVPTDEMDIDQLLKETARVSVTSDRETCSRARPYSPPHGSSTSSVPTTSSLTAGGNEEVHRCIDKHYANQALNTLIRMAISTAEQMAMHNQQNSTTPVAAATDALNKRCLMLLKAALKPSVWGFSASLSHLTYEKQLTACDTPNPTTQQIVQTQVSVEVLSSLIIIIPRNMILEHIGPLQRALCSCVTSNQAAVLRAMYTLLQRLLERSKCTKNGLEEFDTLNQALVRFINDSFNLFERSTPSVLQTIVAPLHILRLMSSENEEFLEAMCMASFTKMINKLVKDHADSMCPKTSSSSSTNRGEPRDFLTTETCYVAIDLLSSQIGRMNNVARKAVCQDVLSVLIERGVCDKLMTVIIKITEEFLKMQDETAVTQGIPLLCRMLKYQEERILGNREILQSFLYSVAHVFETPHLRCADITDRLDPAFYWGVCCNDENLRGRFMAVWDEKISPYLYQRIYYFLTEQDWKPLESQTWVMHCINLCMFSLNGVKRGPPDAKTSSKIKRRYNTALRSRMGNTCTYYDTFAYAVGKDLTTLAEEVPMEDTDYSMVLPENQRYALKLSPTLTNVMEDYETVVVHFMKLRDETGTCVFPEHREEPEVVERPATGAVAKGVDRVFEEFFHLFTVSSFFRFEDLAPDFIELCYSDSELACSVWTKMFTTFWSSLDDEERAKLVPKIITFLGSGQHSGQKDHDMSIIRCFLDAFIQCSPQIPIPLSLISYLASTHNNWHRALLHFEEEMQKLGKTFLRNVHTSPAETTISDQLDLYDALRLMYQKLNEQDQIEMIWERRAFFEETARLLQLRNLGDFAQVKEFTQDVIQRWTEPANAETNAQIQFGSYPLDVRHEVRLWTDIWIDSMRSLGEWGNVFDFANREHAFNSHLLVESCVQLSEWEALKDVIEVYGASIPEDDLPLYYIYNAMTKITQENFDENARNEVDQMEKDASISLITTWRSLPSVVSHSHMGLLRQAQLLQEIHEGAHITRNLACIAMDRKTTDIRDRPIDVTQYAAEIKAVVKTWRNRQLSLMDDFAASTEITNWRLYHFTKIEMEAQLRTAEENKRKELEKDQADKMDTSEAPATELPRPLQTGETVSFMGNIRPATNVLPRMQLFSQALEDMLSLNLNTFSQTVLGLAKIYRQSNHYGMALHQIKSLDVAPQVVRSDACAKTCDLLKTLMKLGHTKSQVINSLSTYFVGKGDRHKYLLEAMECTQHITHDQFTADENSRMLSLRGGVFSKLDADLEAGKAFVIAGKMYNVSGSFTCNYVYKCWGEHLEKLYERSGGVDESSGVQALYCFCSCARVEARSRKYIAKMLWILKQLSNSKSSDILARIQVTFKKLAECVPSANWVIWLNELFHHVKQRNGVLTMPLLCHIAKNNPEPILYAIRKHLQDDLLERQIRNVCRDVEIKFPLVVDIKGDYQEPRRPEDYFDFSKMTKCSQYLMSVLELAVRSRPSDLLNLNIVLSSLESLSRGWYERQMTKLRVLKEQCCKELFDQLRTITTARPSEELCDLVAKWSISAKDLAYRSHCEDYDAVKFVSERFGELAKEVKTGTTLFKLFNKVVEYLELVEQRTKLVTRDGLIRGETAFLTQFSTKIAYIDIFGCVMTTKQQQAQYTEKIARFLPRYTSTYQNGKVYRLVSVLSECGKVYTYAVERRSAKDGLDQNNKESVYRMFGLLNSYIAKDHECSRRLLLFNQPSVLPIGLDMSLVEYAPFGPTYPQPSGNTRFMRYTDIFTESLMEYNIEEHPDRILTKFYNSVVEHMENEGEPDEEFLEKVYMRVAENTEVGKALVPADMMTKWMRRCYANATHEWITRKQTACYLGMYFLSEYMFHLSAMGLDFMVLNIFTGQTVAMEYKFDIHFEAHKGNVNLVNEKVVPFRLSPNLYHFLGASMDGHMKNAMIALARCFESHDAVVMARPLLYDLYHDLLVRSSFDESDAINAVKKSSDAIAERIHGAATLESGKNTVAYMIYEASKKENLSKISPSFHPWF